MTTSNERAVGAAAAQVGPMFAHGRSGLFSLARLQGQVVKAGLRYQIEALSFLKHRYEQDLKLVEDLLAGDEFNDAFDVCATFWQNAQMEYSREAAKIAEIGVTVVSDTARTLRREAKAASADMAAQTVAA